MTEHDNLASLLFPDGESDTLSNFKLLRGPGPAVSPSFVRDQVYSALHQAWVAKTAPKHSTFPASGVVPRTVEEMLAGR